METQPNQRLARLAELLTQDSWEEFDELADTLIAEEKTRADALFLKAIGAYACGDLMGALDYAGHAFELDGNVREYAELLAILHVLLSDLSRGIYFAKLTTALPSSKTVPTVLHDVLPPLTEALRDVEEQPLYRRAIRALMRGDIDNAEHWFRQNIAYDPRARDAYLGLTDCLESRMRFHEAVDVLRGARHALPGDGRIASRLASALLMTGRHAESTAVHRVACALDPDDGTVAAWALADMPFDPSARDADIVAACRSWGERHGVAESGFHIPAFKIPGKERLTVGYVIGRAASRPGAAALAEILAHHDRNGFRAVGFGRGTLADLNNVPFQKCFDVWHNVEDIDPLTLGAMVSAEGVDILVSLSGFDDSEFLPAFALRLAPVQISWGGCLSGTGLASMDVLFTDRVIENGEAAMRERPLPLSMGAMVVDPPHGTNLSRTATGDEPPVLAADVSFGELTLDTVGAWAEVLLAVPEATLILRDHDFRTVRSVQTLLDLFGDFGVLHRIDIVSARGPAEFLEDADVLLLPFGPTRLDTAVTALARGIPVVGLLGDARARRVSASVLTHLGLDEWTVARDVRGYVDLAVHWATHKAGDARAAFADQARDKLASAPLFDFRARMAEIEGVYRRLWDEA